MENNDILGELYHHGVRGQKWGIRRYQNKDGTLTAAGKKRADKLKEKYTALTGKRLIRKPTPKGKAAEETNKKKTLKTMSDEELKSVINRLQMEKQAMQLQADTAGKGTKATSHIWNQMIKPAATQAGKQLLQDTIMKIGKKKLGLDPEAVKDVYDELRKEVDGLELEARKAKAQQTIARAANTKAQQEAQAQKTSENTAKKAKAAKKQRNEPEYMEAEFVGNRNKSSTDLTLYREKKKKWY